MKRKEEFWDEMIVKSFETGIKQEPHFFTEQKKVFYLNKSPILLASCWGAWNEIYSIKWEECFIKLCEIEG